MFAAVGRIAAEATVARFVLAFLAIAPHHTREHIEAATAPRRKTGQGHTPVAAERIGFGAQADVAAGIDQQISRGQRVHADHASQRIAAVQSRGRTAQDFHARQERGFDGAA